MADLNPGATFAGHRIEGIAGRGGMGTVYRATHLALDHVVALKVISGELAADEGFRERFRLESRVAVSLRHPNVVPIHHAGEEDGLLFVTMDLIDGPDLRRLLVAGGPLEPRRATSLIDQVASALDVAHSRGLVHRDIKPGNVLIEQRPDGEHAYLTDFGLAKRFDQATQASGLTGTGAFVGTLDYVAPEQIRGERVDARTDVYALGCVLYEVIAGRPPFGEREENVAKIYAHLQDEPPWLPGDGEDDLDEVIARAMAKQPGDRFPSAGDLARAANAAAAGVHSGSSERSVATGRAAPLTPVETQESMPPTEATPPPTEPTAPPPPPTERTPPPPEPPTEPLAPPPERGGGGPSRGLLIGALAGVMALGIAAVVLLGGGDDESPGGGTEPTTTSETGRGGEFSGAPVEFGDPISIEGFPVGLNIHDNQVSVATRDSQSLVTIDKMSRAPVGDPLPLGGEGEDVAVIGAFAWVTLPQDDAVARVPLDGGPVATITVGDEPRGIVASADSLWVADLSSSEVTKIDADTREATPIPLTDAEPADIAFDEAALWVTDRSGDQVIRRELVGDGEDAFPVGENPKGVVIFNDEVWVANTDSGDVSRLGLDGSDLGRIDVDGTPRGIASGFGSIWVANGGEEDGQGYVSKIDPAGGEPQRLDVEGSPEDIAEGPKRMWVTTGSGNSLISIDP